MTVTVPAPTTEAPAAPPARPVLAARIGRVLYHVFRALPFWASPDVAFLNPGADAAHTAEAVAIPLGEGTIPGCWLAPKAGTGAAVLLVHGATTEALAPYMFFIQALLARGVAVMSVELDGHGANARPFAPEGVAENVPAALQVLFDRPGVDPARVGILGVSLGAACALHATAQRADIRAVAAVGLPLTLSVGLREKLGEALGILSPHCAPIALKMAPDRLFSFLINPMRVAHDSGVVHRHILEAETPRVIDAALRHLAPLQHVERLIAVPLLVLTGAWDNIAPVRHARELHAAAPGPATLAIAPARNHFTIMTCPYAARTLADWFEAHLVTPLKEPTP
jgi:pimeloyl-ACP methyl ester carboxylesterase